MLIIYMEFFGKHKRNKGERHRLFLVLSCTFSSVLTFELLEYMARGLEVIDGHRKLFDVFIIQLRAKVTKKVVVVIVDG